MSFLLSRLRRAGRREPIPEQPNPIVEPEELQIDRKILQDPSACLDSEVQDPLPRGLTPSTRLPSASGSSDARYRAKPKDPSPVAHLQNNPSSFVDILPRAQSITTSGQWPTFGRKRDRQVPDASPLDNPEGTPHPQSAKDSKHLSTDSVLSTFTLSRLTHPSRSSTGAHDKTPSPSTRSPQQSPNIQLSSEQSSPTNTMSSKRHPQTPQRPSSYTAPTSVTNLMTSVPASDSPHTFGHPTPPDKPAKLSVPYLSPPPPLPPLVHPDLTSVLPPPMSTDRTTETMFRDRSNTLPTKRRTLRKDDLFPSLSLKLSRSLRHQPSPAHVKQVSAASEQQESRVPDRRRRARTVSGGVRQRRMSADWSSYQASVGVTSHANQAWPAEVSREILRLSLLGQDGSQGSSTTRGRNVDPVPRPDQGVSFPSFLPFPHPSRPDSPVPLRASATLTDGRETLSPPRPHSLQFNLRNRRGSELPERFTTTEVKRSLSAIEARMTPNNGASGAHFASSGLTDPVPTSSGAPHASLAPTPSRSLFSGQISSTNALAPPSMQGEPSTPTPEPRNISNKSRGKRKAEDNPEVTPPEQKKEGQRATFLLPSESRSQRVSSSSHAPSSYHRKRARLSSSSPFATPVQSRPASVHETPQSGSRNHHFTSLSSSTGAPFTSRTPSRATSTRSRQPRTPSTTRKHEQRLSQASIPISAYISPHAPSIGRSTKFHMRDPRKPPKKPDNTPWGLRFATEDEPGSPIQAWCFFLGFLLFPVWWIAGLLLRVPRTRIAGDVDAEKGVTIDDPQIEHDARVWRFRCRVMAAISLFTYIPFIVLVAIFAPR